MRTMSVGDLISALDNYEPDKEVRFDFCDTVPGMLISWRGIYRELSITWTEYVEKGSNETVAKLKRALENAIGREFIGYKGGYFTMSEKSLVFVDNYGMYTQTCIEGLVDEGYYLIIKTKRETD